MISKLINFVQMGISERIIEIFVCCGLQYIAGQYIVGNPLH